MQKHLRKSLFFYREYEAHVTYVDLELFQVDWVIWTHKAIDLYNSSCNNIDLSESECKVVNYYCVNIYLVMARLRSQLNYLDFALIY